MDTYVMEQHTSPHIIDSVSIVTGPYRTAGMQIIVRSAHPPTTRQPVPPVTMTPYFDQPDPEDDLANATWEDAEWR